MFFSAKKPLLALLCIATATFTQATQTSTWVPIDVGEITTFIPLPAVDALSATGFQSVESVSIAVGSVGATEAYYFRHLDEYGNYGAWQCQTADQVTANGNKIIDDDVSGGTYQYEVSACMTGSGCDVAAYQSGALACSDTALSAKVEVIDNSGVREPIFSDSTPNDPTAMTTAGEFRVTELGAASYTVPIALPKGTAGVQPQVALSYSSQSGSGYMGHGWNVSGLSAITRCPKTYVHDNKIDGVTLTKSDRLCFNGQRLFVNDSNDTNSQTTSDEEYWGTGVKYHTEIDDFSIITPHYDGTRLASFTVETKSGEVHYFGQVDKTQGNDFLGRSLKKNFKNRKSTVVTGADAFVRGASINEAKSWAIKVIKDVKDNYILFEYENNTSLGEHYISEIQYTGNSAQNQAPYAWVKFHYAANKKVRTGWQVGQRVSLTQLLTSVAVHSDGHEYRNYKLDYFTSDFLEEKNYLESIQECVGEKCLKPLTFKWQKKPEITSSVDWYCYTNDIYKPVSQPPSDSEKHRCFSTPKIDPFKPFETTGSRKTTTANSYSAKIFDINGDGFSDIVYVDGSQWKVKLGPNFGSASTLHAGLTAKPEYALIMDYDGDSVLDLLLANSATTNWTVVSYKKSFSKTVTNGHCPHVCYTETIGVNSKLTNIKAIGLEGKTQILDVNGDTLSDIVMASGNEIVFAENLGNGNFAQLQPLITVPNSSEIGGFGSNSILKSARLKNLSALDVNGDGRSDLFFRNATTINQCIENGRVIPGVSTRNECERDIIGRWTSTTSYKWLLYVSTGGKNYTLRQDFGSTDKFEPNLVDLNGDGLTDIMWRSNNTWLYRLSDGTKFLDEKVATTNKGGELTTNIDGENFVRLLDVSGDGRTDLLLPNALNTGWQIYFSRPLPETPSEVVFESRGTYPFNKNKAIQFGDVNGDGKIDLLQSSGDWYVYYGGLANEAEDVIYEIDNGFGVKTRLTYGNITDSEVYYQKESSNRSDENGNPLPNLLAAKSAYFVVSSATTDTGPGTSNAVGYQYGGLLIDKMGRGMLGFERLRTFDLQTCSSKPIYLFVRGIQREAITRYETDTTKCVTTETVYSQTFPYTGMPISTEQRFGIDGPLISSALNKLNVKETSNKGKMPFIEESTEKSYSVFTNEQSPIGFNTAPLAVTTSKFKYDSYGNLTYTEVKEVDATQSGNYRKTISTNDFSTNILHQKLGRLKESTVTKELYENNVLVKHNDNDGTVIRRSSFQYDSSLMLKTETIEPGNAALEVVTSHGYDRWGNKTSVTSTGAVGENGLNKQTRASSTAYDEKGRYKKESTDALGNKTSIELLGSAGDSKGRISEIRTTSPNGITKIAYLDLFGNTYKTTTTSRGANDPTLVSYTYKSFCGTGTSICSNSEAYIRIVEVSAGAPEKQTFIDKWGRTIESRVRAFDGASSAAQQTGTWSVTKQTYNANGDLFRAYEPGMDAASTYHTEYSYDILRRVYKEKKPRGVITRSYNGPTTVTVDEANLIHKETRNYLGQTAQVVSANPAGQEQSKLIYAYAANDELLSVDVYAKGAFSHTQAKNKYNDYGQKIFMDDADKGVWRYSYNAFGELVRQINSDNLHLVQQYDKAGRMVSRKDADGFTDWIYDKGDYAAGKLQQVRYFKGRQSASGVANYQETFTYGSHGKLIKTDLAIDGIPFSIIQGYDRFNRPSHTEYPANNFTIKQTYTNLGYANETINITHGHRDYNKVYQKVVGMNARGQVTDVVYANNVKQMQRYDSDTGWLNLLDVSSNNGMTSAHSLGYSYYDNGNLQTRDHQFGNGTSVHDFVESFLYDDQNRLKTRNRTMGQGSGTEIYSYDALGNFKSKAGVGTYEYAQTNGASRNQVTQIRNSSNVITHKFTYDSRGNVKSDKNRNFHYTAFDKPYLITKGSNKTEFFYAHNRDMYRQILTVGGKVTDTLYVKGMYERVKLPTGVTEHKYHVGNIVVTDRSNNHNETLYLHKDNLGSTVSISNAAGKVVQHLTYDPWGKQSAFYTDSSLFAYVSPATTEGYTGHKMINDLGIIHMNGRIYDPTLGRFLQADPIIQAASDSQSYNRYAYVRNNPLTLIDPSGYSWISKAWKKIKPFIGVIAGVIAATYCGPCSTSIWAAAGTGAAIGAGSAAINGGNIFSGALVGAFSGAAFFKIGQYFKSLGAYNVTYNSLIGEDSIFAIKGSNFGGNFLKSSQIAGQIASHAVAGGIASTIGGGKFGHGFFSAGLTKGIGGAFLPSGDKLSTGEIAQGTVLSAIIGGTASKISGGKFANGAQTGAFQYLFNQLSKNCSGQMCRGIGAKQRDRVEALSVEFGLPALVDGQLVFLSGSATLAYAYGPTNGYDFIFDIDVNYSVNAGLVLGTAEFHHFEGTFSQYDQARSHSLYYGLGGGLLFGPDQSFGVSFGVGFSFGGKWMNNIPYVGNGLGVLKHKGYAFSQDSDAL